MQTWCFLSLLVTCCGKGQKPRHSRVTQKKVCIAYCRKTTTKIMKPRVDRCLKIENKKIWTGTYVKVPTEVMQLLDSEDEQGQRMGHILFFLFRKAYFKDGSAHYAGQVYTCLRGEYIGSMKQLSHACNIPEGSIYRYLKLLENLSYISLRRLKNGMLVRIHAYDDFMDGVHLTPSATSPPKA